jgi:hypothetical protein
MILTLTCGSATDADFTITQFEIEKKIVRQRGTLTRQKRGKRGNYQSTFYGQSEWEFLCQAEVATG